MQLRPYQLKAIEETRLALAKDDEPVLFYMSVGGGKSICIATILQKMVARNKRILCLVSSAELVRNNSSTYRDIGGKPSVFCSSLGQKEYSDNVVFATPQSILAAMKRNAPPAGILFDMIIVDEAHNIPYHNHRSGYMRILRHYKILNPRMRLLGLTGTPFRGAGHPIVGEECLFKTQVANVGMGMLIREGYLANPVFGKHAVRGFDFSNVKIKRTGEFDEAELNAVIDKDERLTGEILREVSELVKNRNGAFIFCATVKHCHEALRSLDDARIITGITPEDERNTTLNDARMGRIKYIISVNCLMVGVDVPRFDTVVWLRPTTSLVLYTQGIGRGLRLFPDKADALILDYAGNIERHADAIEDPELLEPLKQLEYEDKPKVFECQKCSTWNTEYARRCVGLVENRRCDYYFEFKECPSCNGKNDIVARYCRVCEHELLDPNRKLSKGAEGTPLRVISAKSHIFGVGRNTRYTVHYLCHGNVSVYENYYFTNERAIRVFYGKFLKLHHPNPGPYYGKLTQRWVLERLMREVTMPHEICVVPEKNYLKIVAKRFPDIQPEAL